LYWQAAKPTKSQMSEMSEKNAVNMGFSALVI